MVRQLPYNKPAKKGKGMTGFLMVRIIRPCIKRAQQRALDACVLDKNHTCLE
jgi:hypothetical protein